MIRFTCTCGKVLKAPERLAGKSSRCPACGGSVVVPTAPGTSRMALSATPAPATTPARPPQITFQEWPGNDMPAAESPDVYALAAVPPTTRTANVIPAVDPNYVPPAPYQRHPAEKWFVPLTGMKFVIQIAGALSLLTAIGVGLLPHVIREGWVWLNGIAMAAAWAGTTALCIGYGCRFLDAMLEFALAGGDQEIHAPDYEPAAAITSFSRWVFSFLCGPAILLYFACHYAVHCGDMTPLDALILAELVVPAVTWWMMTQVVLATRPNQTRVSPAVVLTVIRRFGLHVLLAGVAATAAASILLGLGAAAVGLLHEDWLVGIFCLWLWWFSIWQASAFLLRRLGAWQYRGSAAGLA